MSEAPFWEVLSLEEMTTEQWESLCDACGKCCVYQLEDESEPERYLHTNVSCRFLDRQHCRCSAYTVRQKLVPDCMKVTAENIASLNWLPETCAYRRLHLGQTLPQWHPLISGDPESVHTAGVSVRGRVLSELDAGDLQDNIVVWNEF